MRIKRPEDTGSLIGEEGDDVCPRCAADIDEESNCPRCGSLDAMRKEAKERRAQAMNRAGFEL